MNGKQVDNVTNWKTCTKTKAITIIWIAIWVTIQWRRSGVGTAFLPVEVNFQREDLPQRFCNVADVSAKWPPTLSQLETPVYIVPPAWPRSRLMNDLPGQIAGKNAAEPTARRPRRSFVEKSLWNAMFTRVVWFLIASGGTFDVFVRTKVRFFNKMRSTKALFWLRQNGWCICIKPAYINQHTCTSRVTLCRHLHKSILLTVVFHLPNRVRNSCTSELGITVKFNNNIHMSGNAFINVLKTPAMAKFTVFRVVSLAPHVFHLPHWYA